MIDGVKLTPLKQIFDERGKVMHMLREDSSVFSRFGEIYFSCTHPGVVKAWHMHKKMTLNYAVIYGEIKFVLYDDRPQSPTKGELQEFFISPENYILVTVPPYFGISFNKLLRAFKTISFLITIPKGLLELELSQIRGEDPLAPNTSI